MLKLVLHILLTKEIIKKLLIKFVHAHSNSHEISDPRQLTLKLRPTSNFGSMSNHVFFKGKRFSYTLEKFALKSMGVDYEKIKVSFNSKIIKTKCLCAVHVDTNQILKKSVYNKIKWNEKLNEK